MHDTDDLSRFPRELIEEAREETSPAVFESLYSRVLNMNVSDKIKLATLGNREARTLLIKDANKSVVLAVMNSPKLTDEEIAAYAGNKNMSPDVIRIISEKREYVKKYPVRLALVNNPKTPLPAGIRLLATLMEKDLKAVSKSKSVPSAIALHARRTLATRGKT
jgi:hypothetical protein